MKNQPVAIVTPAYNVAAYLGACIESVLSQTYQNWDMYIVNDASTDRTGEIAKSYAQSHANIHYLELPQNSRCAGAPRNAVLPHIDTPIIAFLDSDDLFMPQKLERQMDFMQQTQAAVSYTGYRYLSPDNKRLSRVIPVPDQIDAEHYKSNRCIAFSSAIVNRDRTGDLHFSDDPAHLGKEDYLLWLDVLRDHTAYGLNEDLTRYRRGHLSATSGLVKAAVQSWELFHEDKDMTEWQRLKAFSGYAYNAVRKRMPF